MSVWEFLDLVRGRPTGFRRRANASERVVSFWLYVVSKSIPGYSRERIQSGRQKANAVGVPTDDGFSFFTVYENRRGRKNK